MSSSSSCEGKLLVPSDPDRSDRWREHLMSGNRMTVVLEAVNDQGPGEGYLLWGESYRREKLFEVNLGSVRSYVVRRRIWHEVTARDDRKFVLSFEDGEPFAMFYKHLENALKSLGKFTTAEGSPELEERDSGDGRIFVLRVDRVPPKKPPRFLANDPSDDEILGVDVCDCAPPQGVAITNNFVPSTDLGHSKIPVKLPRSCVTGHDKRTSTVWYADVCDINSQNNISKSIELIKNAGEHIYDSIGGAVNTLTLHDGINSTAVPTTGASGSGRIPTEPVYDNATSVLYSKPNRHKKKYPAGWNTPATDVAGHRNARLYDNPDGFNGPAERQCFLMPEQRGDSQTTSRVGDGGMALGRSSPKPRPRNDCSPPVPASSPAQSWTCERCTLVNPTTTKQCVACGTNRNPPREEANNQLCRMPSSYVLSSDAFHRLVTSTAGGGGGVDDGWQCSRCEARNCSDSKSCRVCSTWVCGHCTLHNHSEHLACSTCGSPKFNIF